MIRPNSPRFTHIALITLFLSPIPLSADTTVSGDIVVTGQTGVGTTAPRARFGVEMKEEDDYVLKVSSQNGAAMLLLDRNGELAIGLEEPGANVDVHGTADDAAIALQLRVGNSSSSVASVQIAFGQGSTDSLRRHNIRTGADPDQNLNNRMDFYLWKSTGEPNALGDLHVLSLQAVDPSSGSVHVMPLGDPTVELVVSDGSTYGVGEIQGTYATHSSKERKFDVSYLSETEEKAAYRETKNLRHAEFRYKRAPGHPPAALRRGLIYEDVPPSLQGGTNALSLDARVLNAEMALKETYRQIKRLEALIAEREAQ